METNYAIQFVKATEAAAIASARWLGRGDPQAANRAATEKLRDYLARVDISGTVVISAGERDKAPMLFIGERVGSGQGEEMDIAVDALDGRSCVASGQANACSVIVAAPRGGLLRAPDILMYKIACGPKAYGVIDITDSVSNNVRYVAEALDKDLDDMTVMILNRERHHGLIREVRGLGARIALIEDGDVSGAIATCLPDSGIDMLIGSGGAPEGVLAAAALRCFGGDMQGRLVYANEAEKERVRKMKYGELNRVLQIPDMAGGEKILFSATGVTHSSMLGGVVFAPHTVTTNSLVLCSNARTIRYIETHHHNANTY